MYQITFFNTCKFFPSEYLYLDQSVVKYIKCSPSKPILAHVLLQGYDCHGANANKGQQPKCPQRGLGKISELYYLAPGSQATQGMASSDKRGIPFVCTSSHKITLG